jgi:elongation factor 1-beta
MANAIVTMRIMPEGVEIDLSKVQHQVDQKINAFGGKKEKRFEIKPVAFGLKALEVVFMMNEDLGDPESLEQDIASIDGVQSCETVGVSRALG